MFTVQDHNLELAFVNAHGGEADEDYHDQVGSQVAVERDECARLV